MSDEPITFHATNVAMPVQFAIADNNPRSFSIYMGSNELLRITATNEVIAPDLESASEAGRVFVESIRHYLPRA